MGMYKEDSTQIYHLSSPPQTFIFILEKIHYWFNKLIPPSILDTVKADNIEIFFSYKKYRQENLPKLYCKVDNYHDDSDTNE